MWLGGPLVRSKNVSARRQASAAAARSGEDAVEVGFRDHAPARALRIHFGLTGLTRSAALSRKVCRSSIAPPIFQR